MPQSSSSSADRRSSVNRIEQDLLAANGFSNGSVEDTTALIGNLIGADDGNIEPQVTCIKEEGFHMRKAIACRDTKEALRHATAMLWELRNSDCADAQYYRIYCCAISELDKLKNYLRVMPVDKLRDYYEIVQHAGNTAPRLYLTILVASMLLQYNAEVPAPVVLQDLLWLLRITQHPLRGLYTRYYAKHLLQGPINRRIAKKRSETASPDASHSAPPYLGKANDGQENVPTRNVSKSEPPAGNSFATEELGTASLSEASQMDREQQPAGDSASSAENPHSSYPATEGKKENCRRRPSLGLVEALGQQPARSASAVADPQTSKKTDETDPAVDCAAAAVPALETDARSQSSEVLSEMPRDCDITTAIDFYLGDLEAANKLLTRYGYLSGGGIRGQEARERHAFLLTLSIDHLAQLKGLDSNTFCQYLCPRFLSFVGTLHDPQSQAVLFRAFIDAFPAELLLVQIGHLASAIFSSNVEDLGHLFDAMGEKFNSDTPDIGEESWEVSRAVVGVIESQLSRLTREAIDSFESFCIAVIGAEVPQALPVPALVRHWQTLLRTMRIVLPVSLRRTNSLVLLSPIRLLLLNFRGDLSKLINTDAAQLTSVKRYVIDHARGKPTAEENMTRSDDDDSRASIPETDNQKRARSLKLSLVMILETVLQYTGTSPLAEASVREIVNELATMEEKPALVEAVIHGIIQTECPVNRDGLSKLLSLVIPYLGTQEAVQALAQLTHKVCTVAKPTIAINCFSREPGSPQSPIDPAEAARARDSLDPLSRMASMESTLAFLTLLRQTWNLLAETMEAADTSRPSTTKPEGLAHAEGSQQMPPLSLGPFLGAIIWQALELTENCGRWEAEMMLRSAGLEQIALVETSRTSPASNRGGLIEGTGVESKHLLQMVHTCCIDLGQHHWALGFTAALQAAATSDRVEGFYREAQQWIAYSEKEPVISASGQTSSALTTAVAAMGNQVQSNDHYRAEDEDIGIVDNGYSEASYEFLTLAITAYEENLVNTKDEYSSLLSIIDLLLSQMVNLEENSFDSITVRVCNYSARLLRKHEQCRAILKCALLFLRPDRMNIGRANECLKRAQQMVSHLAGTNKTLAGTLRTEIAALAKKVEIVRNINHLDIDNEIGTTRTQDTEAEASAAGVAASQAKQSGMPPPQQLVQGAMHQVTV